MVIFVALWSERKELVAFICRVNLNLYKTGLFKLTNKHSCSRFIAVDFTGKLLHCNFIIYAKLIENVSVRRGKIIKAALGQTLF